ncbi:MAG TPA: hypothetical protein PLV03_04175 [Clostridiales bacterium]|nr:hypothetical protein [Clostridiales bacterium]
MSSDTVDGSEGITDTTEFSDIGTAVSVGSDEMTTELALLPEGKLELPEGTLSVFGTVQPLKSNITARTIGMNFFM